MTFICLLLVAALVYERLDRRRERDTLLAQLEVADELPDDDEPMVVIEYVDDGDALVRVPRGQA